MFGLNGCQEPFQKLGPFEEFNAISLLINVSTTLAPAPKMAAYIISNGICCLDHSVNQDFRIGTIYH